MNLTNVVQLPMAAYAIAFHAEIVTVLFGGKFLDSSWLLPLIVGFATVGRVGEPVTLVAQYQEKASIILLSKVVRQSTTWSQYWFSCRLLACTARQSRPDRRK